MKIIDNTPKIKPVNKTGTKVGEVYRVTDGSGGPHLRCQGGFVNLGGGSYTNYEIARDDACWIHIPDAVLTIN